VTPGTYNVIVRANGYADSSVPATITTEKTTDVGNVIMHSGSSGTLEAPGFDICEAIVIILFAFGIKMQNKICRTYAFIGA
jgi:hypothetical protein